MKVLLIIPCFNEESRLRLDAFKNGLRFNQNKGISLHCLFANDGSTDNTKLILDSYTKETPHLAFHSPENLGKGNVIQAAHQANIGMMQDYDWIGFWDADLATPLEEIPRMLEFMKFYNERKVHSIWGSRVSRLGSTILRQPHRHYLGRIFVTIVSLFLNVKAYDSQCGAKLFTPEAAKKAFEKPFISRWIFDVEILLRLKDFCIIEFPVFEWRDIPGSKIKIFKEIFRVGKDIVKIRQEYL
jgi:dolichyl-phosphate beta-glucosyltransferase